MKIEVKIPSGLVAITVLNVIFGITSLVYGTSFLVIGISRLISGASTNGSVPSALELLPFGIPSFAIGVALIFTSEAFLEGNFRAYLVAIIFYILILVREILMVLFSIHPLSHILNYRLWDRIFVAIIAMPPSPLDISIIYSGVNPIFPSIITTIICLTALLFLLTPNIQKWFIQRK